MIVKRLITILLLLGACATTTGAKQDSENGRAFHATVQLQSEIGQTFCSGVVVGEVVLTAFHCVMGSAPVYVKDLFTTWKAQLVGSTLSPLPGLRR